MKRKVIIENGDAIGKDKESRLITLMSDSGIGTSIKLENEIEALELYSKLKDNLGIEDNKFEYRIVSAEEINREIKNSASIATPSVVQWGIIEKYLNQVAKDGWELVTVVKDYNYIFKRSIL